MNYTIGISYPVKRRSPLVYFLARFFELDKFSDHPCLKTNLVTTQYTQTANNQDKTKESLTGFVLLMAIVVWLFVT